MTVSEIHSQFRHAFNIVLCSTWLSECISFLQSQPQQQQNAPPSPLLERVYEQFLYSDLKASLAPQPAMGHQEPKLTSDLILQVVDWLDVSLSISAQIENEHDRLQDHARRIIAVDDEDSPTHATGHTSQSASSLAPSAASNSPSKKRLLKLWLTDGNHNTLLAIEASSLGSMLDTASLSPGYKLCVKSGTPAMHQTLLLTPERVECFGGGFVETPTDFSLLKRLEARLEHAKSRPSSTTATTISSRPTQASGSGSRNKKAPCPTQPTHSISRPTVITIDDEGKYKQHNTTWHGMARHGNTSTDFLFISRE